MPVYMMRYIIAMLDVYFDALSRHATVLSLRLMLRADARSARVTREHARCCLRYALCYALMPL